MKDITLTPTEQETIARNVHGMMRTIMVLEAQVFALKISLTVTLAALLMAMYKLFLGGAG